MAINGEREFGGFVASSGGEYQAFGETILLAQPRASNPRQDQLHSLCTQMCSSGPQDVMHLDFLDSDAVPKVFANGSGE